MKTYTIELNDADAKRLERLACIEQVDTNELMRRALASEEFFVRQELEGKTVLLEYPDSFQSRVTWPQRYGGRAA